MYGCQSCSRSAEQGKQIFPCPRWCPRIWSRETGSSVPSPVNPHILQTQAESDWLVLNSRGSFRFQGRRPSIPSAAIGLVPIRVYRVTQMRTDGVHCRESADTGLVVIVIVIVLKVARVTGAAFSGTVSPWASFCAPRFSHTCHLYVVLIYGTLDTESTRSRFTTVCRIYCTVCMYVHHIQQSMDQPGKVANPARGQLNRENK